MYVLNKQKVNGLIDIILERLGITKEEQNGFIKETVIDNNEEKRNKRKDLVKDDNTSSEEVYLKYRFELIKQIINCDKCKECDIDKLEVVKMIVNIKDSKIQELIDVMNELDDIAKWVCCLIM
jgi:hypothetical protein